MYRMIIVVIWFCVVQGSLYAEDNDLSFEPLPYGMYVDHTFWWDNTAKSIRTGFSPDGLYYEGSVREQLLSGTVTFVNDVVPIEFVGWINPEGNNMALTSPDGSLAFYELFSHTLWLTSGGGSHSNIGKLEVVGVQADDSKPWRDVCEEGYPVANISVFFRVRLVLSDEERSMIFKDAEKVGVKDEAHLRMSLDLDIGKIPGNEELAKALDARKGGLPNKLYIPAVGFTLVKSEKLESDKDLRVAQALWKIEKEKEDNEERWVWYERLLSIKGQSEYTLLEYADDLRKNGEAHRAEVVYSRLMEAVKNRPNSIDQIPGINRWESREYMPYYNSENHNKMGAESLVILVKKYVDELHKMAKAVDEKESEEKELAAGSTKENGIKEPLPTVKNANLPSDLVEVSGAVYADLSGLASGSSTAQAQQKAAVAESMPLEVRSAKTGIAFRLIPAGSFMMGSSSDEANRDSDETQHQVTISTPFYCGKFEVTQGLWQQVMGSNPAYFKNAGSDAPVERVSWDDCQEFLKKLCLLEGVPEGTYRLLTEAQWEYACRAGTETPFCFGNDFDSGMANFDGNHPYGDGLKGTYRQTTVSVGQYRPNAFGLYDMYGNVWEWCGDWYTGDYSSESVTDPQAGDLSYANHVFRGGSWILNAFLCRSANRLSFLPSYTSNDLGFRLLRTCPDLVASENKSED